MNKNKTSISTTPIHDIDFSGLHWIGSIRRFGQDVYFIQPDGADFTRAIFTASGDCHHVYPAAAAELKTRIRKRLQESQRFFDARRSFTEQENQVFAQQCSDPLQAKILGQFAHQVGYAL